MGSKRDRFKKLNEEKSAKAATQGTTIVDELRENYEKQESVANDPVPAKEPEIMQEPISDEQPTIKEEKAQIVDAPKQSKKPKKDSAPVEASAPVQEEPVLINVINKSNVGRPKILEGVYKPISARLKMENYEHARLVGGKYGGMNAYLNWLIEQDMKNTK